GVFGDRLAGSGGQRQSRSTQDGADCGGVDAADAVVTQDAGDFGFAEPGGALWSRGQLEQGPDPGLIGGLSELEQLREEAMPLLAEAVGVAAELLVEFVFEAGELAQADHGGLIEADLAEAVRIGAQGVGQHEGVAAVVLGSGRRVAIAEAVQLFGVDREDAEAVFD
ncbi:MAG TPA: hypothetical protein VGR96_03775, partial [Acidobacteriaceae bacterium]|nr:hypothetical protein [Acidobacteriaceae bacterium]